MQARRASALVQPTAGRAARDASVRAMAPSWKVSTSSRGATTPTRHDMPGASADLAPSSMSTCGWKAVHQMHGLGLKCMHAAARWFIGWCEVMHGFRFQVCKMYPVQRHPTASRRLHILMISPEGDQPATPYLAACVLIQLLIDPIWK